MNKNLTKNIKRTADGSVDVELTRAAYSALLLETFATSMAAAEKKLQQDHDDGLKSFDADLATYVAERGTWDPLSKEFIDAAFDRFSGSAKGGCITKPTLVSLVCNAMLGTGRIEFAQMKHAQTMIAAFIDDNAGTLYSVEKGKDGGVRRLPPPVSTAAPECTD